MVCVRNYVLGKNKYRNDEMKIKIINECKNFYSYDETTKTHKHSRYFLI